MPNPHIGDNGRQCYWVTGRDWWYRLAFGPVAATDDVAELVLDGVDGHADVHLNGQALGRVVARVEGHGFASDVSVHRPGRCRLYASIQVRDPQLWWPNGFGSQPLYSYHVSLLVDGQVVEEMSGHFGFREVTIEETPFTEEAGPGISFWSKSMGSGYSAKGATGFPSSYGRPQSPTIGISSTYRRPRMRIPTCSGSGRTSCSPAPGIQWICPRTRPWS